MGTFDKMADAAVAISTAVPTRDNQESNNIFVCKNYSSNLLSKLSSLWKQNAFCDVEIKVMEKSFPTHRFVLSAASPYFQVMFLSGMAESGQSVVEIHNVDPYTFEQLLDYMYSGKVLVDDSNVQALLPAAKMFQIEDVEGACCKYLASQLDPCNCIGINQFAVTHACDELTKLSRGYLCRHFVDVRKSEEFAQADIKEVIKILGSEDLKIETEDEVFIAAVDWILYNVQMRREYLGQLLELVRLPLISTQFLDDYLKTCQNSSVQRMLNSLVEQYRNYQILTKTSKHSLSGTFKYNCPRKSAKKYFYFPGGFCRSVGGRWSDTVCFTTVERYDTFLNTCAGFKAAQLHFARSGHGVAALDGLLYCMGGENDSLIYDSTECFDPLLNIWSLVAPMTVPRVGLGVCTIEDYIYAVGGWVGDQIGETIERYDREADRWDVVGQVQTRRFQFGVTELNGCLFAVGGIGETGEDLNSTEYFNPVTEWWTTLSNMKHKRASVGLGSLNGCLYACGGHNETNGALASVEKYIPETNTWHEVKPMLGAKAGVGVASHDGLLYVLGGRTAGTGFSAPVTLPGIECYDPRSNTWNKIADMLFSRAEGGVAVI